SRQEFGTASGGTHRGLLDGTRDARAGVDAELHEDAAQVRLDGLFGQEEVACNLAVGLVIAYTFGDLAFTATQRGDPGASGGRALGGRVHAAPDATQLAHGLQAVSLRPTGGEVDLGGPQQLGR